MTTDRRCVAVLLLATFAFESPGEVTIFTSESEFLATVDVVSTLDFDSFPVGPITEQFIEQGNPDRNPLFDDLAFRSDCFRPDSPCWHVESGAGGNYLRSEAEFENLQMVTFGTSQNFVPGPAPYAEGLGFRIVSERPFSEIEDFQMRFHIFQKDGNSLTTSLDAADLFGTGDGWVGFSSPVGIWRVIVEDPPQGPRFPTIPFGLDDIAHSQIVPEPSFGLLTGWCASMVLFGLRRSREQ